MKFPIKDLFSKCEEINSKLRTSSHLLTKSLMQNFIFCAVTATVLLSNKQFVTSINVRQLYRFRGKKKWILYVCVSGCKKYQFFGIFRARTIIEWYLIKKKLHENVVPWLTFPVKISHSILVIYK